MIFENYLGFGRQKCSIKTFPKVAKGKNVFYALTSSFESLFPFSNFEKYKQKISSGACEI